MIKRMKSWSDLRKAITILLVFYIPFHLWLTPGYWDDAVFARVLGQYHYNLIKYTADRYMTWSSRISIELMLPVMTALPAIVWKTVDILMILLLFFDIRWTLAEVFGIKCRKTDIITAVLICGYPFATMAQTGWIATTMNYLWVLALGWYAINRMLSTTMQRSTVSIREIILTVFAVFYSAGYESMAAILFMVEMGIVIYSCKKVPSHVGMINGEANSYSNKRRRVSGLVWTCMGITVLMLLYILLCPGNQLRPLKDAELWMPDYFNLAFYDKIRLAILSAFMHFVSIPSPIFFILNLAVFILGMSRGKRAGVVAVMPVVLDIIWTCCFLLSYLGGVRSFTYQVPAATLVGTKEQIEQAMLILSVLIWFASVLYTLFQNMPEWKALCVTVILVIACLPEMAVGITPTVYASILRTTIYLYMAMIVAIVNIYQEIHWEAHKKEQLFFRLCMGGGILLNAFQLARHIVVYG